VLPSTSLQLVSPFAPRKIAAAADDDDDVLPPTRSGSELCFLCLPLSHFFSRARPTKHFLPRTNRLTPR